MNFRKNKDIYYILLLIALWPSMKFFQFLIESILNALGVGEYKNFIGLISICMSILFLHKFSTWALKIIDNVKNDENKDEIGAQKNKSEETKPPSDSKKS